MNASLPTFSLLIPLVAQSFNSAKGAMPAAKAGSSAGVARSMDSATPVIHPTFRVGNQTPAHNHASVWDSESRGSLQFSMVGMDYHDAKDFKAPYNAPMENKDSVNLSEDLLFQRGNAVEQKHSERDSGPSSLEAKPTSPVCKNAARRDSSVSEQIDGLSSKNIFQKRRRQARALSSLLLTRKNSSAGKTGKQVKKIPLMQVNRWITPTKDEATRRKELAEYLKEVEVAVLANPQKPINAAMEAGAKILQRNVESYCIAQNIKCTPTTQLPTALLHAVLEESPAGEFLAAVEEKLSEIEVGYLFVPRVSERRTLVPSPSKVKGEGSAKTSATNSSKVVDKASKDTARAQDSTTSRAPHSTQEHETPRDDAILPMISAAISPLIHLMRSSDQAIGDTLGDIFSGLSIPPSVHSSSWILTDRREECSMTKERTPTEISKCKSFVMEIPVPPDIVLEPSSLSWEDPLNIRKLFVWGFELSCLSQLGCASATEVLQPDVFDGTYEFSHLDEQNTFVYMKDFGETPVEFYTGDKVYKLFLVVSDAGPDMGVDEEGAKENKRDSIWAAIVPDSPHITDSPEESAPYAHTDKSPFATSEHKDVYCGAAAENQNSSIFCLSAAPTRWHVVFPGNESDPSRTFLVVLKVRPWV